MKKSIFPFCLLMLISQLLLMSSCGSPESREVVIENKFKMQLPGYLSSNNLNEDASLMYANLLREVYVMVMEDTFEAMHNALVENELTDDYSSDFNGFCKLVSNDESDAFLITDDRPKLKDTTINGMQSRYYENTRKINGVDAYYKLALVTGKSTYYQVIAWTLASRADRHDKALKEMIDSFEEL